MKIRKKLVLLFLLIANYSSSQTTNDKVLKNVLLIENKDFVKVKEDYLLDIIIDENETPIIYNNSNLPTEFFNKKLFRSKPFLLISPDKEYYNSSKKRLRNIPFGKNIYYQKKIVNHKSEIDSIKRSDNHQPKLIFNTTKRNKTDIIYYYKIEFGSTCCMRDYRWDRKERLEKIVSSFEKSNNAKIGDIYKTKTGTEGRHTLYFTLSNLSKKQKVLFLEDIKFWKAKEEFIGDYIDSSSDVYLPSLVNKEGLELISDLSIIGQNGKKKSEAKNIASWIPKKDTLIEIKNENLLHIGKVAIINGSVSPFKIGIWKTYNKNKELIRKGAYKIGTYTRCGVIPYEAYYHFKTGIWNFYNTFGIRSFILEFTPKEYHLPTNCMDGAKIIFGIIDMPHQFYHKIPTDQIYNLQKVFYHEFYGIRTLTPLNGKIFIERP